MPKMFVHSPEGTFSAESRALAAQQLTALGMSCEKLIESDPIKRGIWVFFNEYVPDAVFSGGASVSVPQIALIAYAIRGGLDDEARTRFIGGATAILQSHSLSTDVVKPIYVVIQETPALDWGMYGKQVDLASMQKE